MDNKRLDELFVNNGVDESDFENKVYNVLIRGIFETICKEIKRLGKRTEELSKYRKSDNHYTITKNIVAHYTGCKISDEESIYLTKLLKAHF